MQPSSSEQARRGRVLAIDDEPLMVKVISRMLSLDHEVLGSPDAQQAIDWIRDGQRFDVILCDMMMPHVSGMDFHAELLRIAPEQAERVIFLTGGAYTPHTQAFLETVDNPRLEKPFDPAALRALVSARMDAR
jgi:CheY-like chemotaxis protein